VLALLREISLRHWARSPLRSLLVVVGIALGVALYVATEAAAASMIAAFDELVARVSGRADLTVEAPGLGVPSELLATVADTPGVEHAAVSLEVTAQATEYQESLLVLGVDFLGDLHFLPFNVEEGEQNVIEDPLAFVNDPTALLVSRHFAKRHGLTKGSRLQLLTSEGPKDFHVRGVLEDSGPAASFGGQVAVMFLDAVQVSFARGTFVDRIDIAASKDQDLDALRSKLQKTLGPGLRVEPPERMGTRLRALTEPLHAALFVSGILALIVGGFLVYNAVGVAVAQRRREIGTLRALGVTRRGTTWLFAAEAGALALPAIALGLVLGEQLSLYTTSTTIETLNRLYASVPQITPKLTPMLIAQATISGLAMAILAAWWPARRGAAIDPAIVLRGSASVEASRPRVVPMLAGGLVLMAASWAPWLAGTKIGGALAVTFTILGAALCTPAVVVAMRTAFAAPVEAVLGIPGRLGLDYVERTLGRSTVNVLALMVAVSMSVSVGGWLASLERSIVRWAKQAGTADLTVTQGSPVIDRRHVAFNQSAADKMRAVPGVAAIQRFRMIETQVQGVSFRLVATDTDVFFREAEARDKGWQVVEGQPLEAGALSRKPSIVLSENAAKRLRVKPGQTLTLTTPAGSLQVEILSTIVDYSSETGAGFIDYGLLREHFRDDVVDGVFAYLKPGEDKDRAADGIRAALRTGGDDAAKNAVFVTQTEAVEKHLLDTLRQTFSYSRAVELMTLLIALMGVIGTMAAAVIDRVREISMLRAVGATTRQVATSIVSEAAFLGFCAAIAGLGVGILECHLFLDTLLAVQTGWHLDFVFPWAASTRTSLLVVATSAIAGGLPAWRAARTPIVTGAVGE
jgi:putative ABC transport system permease protein